MCLVGHIYELQTRIICEEYLQPMRHGGFLVAWGVLIVSIGVGKTAPLPGLDSSKGKKRCLQSYWKPSLKESCGFGPQVHIPPSAISSISDSPGNSNGSTGNLNNINALDRYISGSTAFVERKPLLQVG